MEIFGGHAWSEPHAARCANLLYMKHTNLSHRLPCPEACLRRIKYLLEKPSGPHGWEGEHY